MGRLLLVWRLVIGDIKRRRLQSVLLLLMIVTTTTTLTIGLALHKVTDSPFARTRAATRGPDIVAEVLPPPGANATATATATATRQFAPLLRAPGVVGTSGPYPVAFVRLTAHGADVQAEAQGRDAAPAAIDQPALTAGRWVVPGGVVIERGFADALGVGVGDPIHLSGRTFTVAGIAVSAAQCFYPVSTPGVIWLTRGDADALAASTQRIGYVLNLKLADPASVQAFENGSPATAFGNGTSDDTASLLTSWQDIQNNDFKVVAVDQKVLLIVSTLLALLAIASIAVVVGSRMAEQTRRVGLLKAVGATPLLVAVRLVARRTRRSLLTAASMTIAVTMVVAALTLQHNVDVRDQHNGAAGYVIGSTSVGDRVTHLVFLLSAILIVLAAINAIFTTWATVIDAQRPTALAPALGATPGQITAGLATSQLMPGLLAACLGIPLGLALYQLAGGHVAQASPPVLSLLAVIPGTLIVVATLTAIPARIGARRQVAEVLRSE